MTGFGIEDEGKIIRFTVEGEDRHGILAFLGIHPYIIDEVGHLWLFRGNEVYKVDMKTKWDWGSHK